MVIIGRAFVNGKEFLFDPKPARDGGYDVNEKLMAEYEAEKIKEKERKEQDERKARKNEE